jgi:hypothetical protein
MLEVCTGVLNKVYNLKEEVVEVVARDGATFTKNPDIHGMFTDREDVIIPKEIVNNPNEVVNPLLQIAPLSVRESAAYFQYGWIAGPMPIPFGRKEIIWLDYMKRTDDHYGYSPVQMLSKSLQMLMYMVESDLEYYNELNDELDRLLKDSNRLEHFNPSLTNTNNNLGNEDVNFLSEKGTLRVGSPKVSVSNINRYVNFLIELNVKGGKSKKLNLDKLGLGYQNLDYISAGFA